MSLNLFQPFSILAKTLSTRLTLALNIYQNNKASLQLQGMYYVNLYLGTPVLSCVFGEARKTEF